MKKLLSLFVIGAMLISLAGCSAVSKNLYDEDVVNGGAVFDSLTDIIGDAGAMDGDYKTDMDADDYYEGVDVMSPEEGIVSEGGDGSETPQVNFVAGTLTAGEWKDADDTEFWTKLLNRNEWYQYMEMRNLFPTKIVTINVHDEDKKPCYNAEVSLLDKNGDIVYSARTDINGKAYLLFDLNNSKETATEIKVGEQIFEITDETNVDVVTQDAGVEVRELDLMLMVDTTGSMSDELKYLQKELEDVIKRISKADEALSINVSVNFYRDETDEYEIRAYDFESNIEKVIKQLNKQEADGGGDYPEAVHTALKSAVKEHQWRDNAVKLCFLILDAPPHDENDIQGINSEIQSYIKEAAAKGIRIIPVASSGVDTETEFLLRSYALMTGGTYVFLTNHSGVGGSHLEPTIGEYKVEALNELMIRVISEYCGLQYSQNDSNQQQKITVKDFSYAEDKERYAEEKWGVKTMGFVNTLETEITSQNVAEHAEKECTVRYDSINISYDTVEKVWRVSFYTLGVAGGGQDVYLDYTGKTLLIVYGE